MAALFGWPAPAATAQSTPAPTAWAATGDKPAPTQWQQHPAVNSRAVPPPPVAPSPGPIGSRVVVFTKPAGDIRPVQATEPKPVNGNGRSGRAGDDVRTPEKEKAGLVIPLQREPERSRVFRLLNDEEMFADPMPGMKTTMADMLREIQADNDKRMKEYQEALDKFNKDPNRNEKDPPKPPQLLRAEDLTVSTAGMALGTPPPTKTGFSPTRVLLEPGYVVHRRLLFEEMNSERYGWELGMFQPFLSTAYFWKDTLFWPSHLASNLFERFDTSAGKCPPGSPVPYLLYPPKITFRGGVVGAATVLGVVFLLAP